MTQESSPLAQLHIATIEGNLNSQLFNEVAKNPTYLSECDVLDFKQQIPNTDAEYVKTIRDLVALHNSYGGFLIFGIREVLKDRDIEIVGVERNGLQINKIRDLVRAYTGADIRVKPIGFDVNDKYIEAIWIAKRGLGESPVRFIKNGPEDKPGKLIFKKGEVVFRRIENNAVAKEPEDYDFLFSERKPLSLELSIINSGTHSDPLDHNLPDRGIICSNFVGRGEDIGDLWKWLFDDFSRVRLIAGEGGLGKTSLAYHFSEQIASRRVKPYAKIVWLTAKARQFIPAKDAYRDAEYVDFSDAESLFKAIAIELGCVESDIAGLTSKELMQLAIESCIVIPSFIVIDDIDSLSQEDQLRTLEFGMRTPAGTKILLTTRVNFSYSPDNVLKLNGLPDPDFQKYVTTLRKRYELPTISESKIKYLREVTGGSPLFTDSLIRLERRGLALDQAMSNWKGEKGLEVRKAALSREVQQLSREAKRVLFVVSTLKNCSYVELSQVVDYSDQTLGDALQELSSLFLISAPSIAKEARYTVEPNTSRLVLEMTSSLGIDHAALIDSTKRSKSDAIGLGLQRRSGIVGLAISEAIATLKSGNPQGALETIQAASKKVSKPHPDLLLAMGRFALKLPKPDYDLARKSFANAYGLGQRKSMLFDLWFEAEYACTAFENAADVASKAIENGLDKAIWYERSAEMNISIAYQIKSRFSNDAALRHVDLSIKDLEKANKLGFGEIQHNRINKLIEQTRELKKKLLEN
jgi:hypothetical protein